MWETPFDVSMLDKGVIIHCPDQDLVEDLFNVFKSHGIKWLGSEPMSITNWSRSGEDTCYRVTKDHSLKYGNTSCYSDPCYDNYIKCTFYGTEPDLEISDANFEAIISAGITKGGRSYVG